MGVALVQGKQTIAYFSKAIHGRLLLLPTYKKEMLPLVLAVQKWRHYLLGRSFVVRTNHSSLKYLWDQRIHIVSQQKWLLKLLGLDFILKCKQRVHNRVANALSRRDDRGPLDTISANQSIQVE